MAQARLDLDLPHEAIRQTGHLLHVGENDLDRLDTVRYQVLDFVDGSHSALADYASHAIVADRLPYEKRHFATRISTIASIEISVRECDIIIAFVKLNVAI
jgi:hypothetical protein